MEVAKFVRVTGEAGSGFTPILRKILAYPSVGHSSVFIEEIFFDSEHGLLGWVSNALGLYEGGVAARGKVPAHLPELIRLRGVRYLIFDNFHDAFYVQGVSRAGMAKDINLLLSACADLRIIVTQKVGRDDFVFIDLLEHPVCDIRT
ncbi:hypothetical protein KRR23_14425 [Pseudomonas sp. CVAP|uniref:hypothetical protein n=1 Tax=Pseudomonas sp. CVAP\|nr:hypothetical protein [Pseudomonas sp. CVAP\